MDGGAYKPTNFPYLTFSENDGAFRLSGDTPGGIVVPFKAGAALLIGDVVYLSAAHTVNKSGTEANYAAAIGVVVGGTSTDLKVLQDDVDVGEQAAAANEVVLVMILGKAKVVAGAAVTLGNKLTVDATSGRVAPATITTDLVAGDTGRILGIALETASDGDKFLMLVALH